MKCGSNAYSNPREKTLRNASLTMSKKALFYALFGTW